MAEHDTGEFSVCQFFASGADEYVRRNVDAKTAVEAAHHYCHSVGAQMGATTRVIITDGDDCTNFEWIFGKGGHIQMKLHGSPTKADPFDERMLHAFGKQQIERSFHNMVTAHGCNLFDYLTDEARDELLRRCIVSHKIIRRYNAENRRHYRERASR